MKKTIKEAKKLALQEIGKYGTPNPTHFQIANNQGQKLAKKHKANKDVVLLGTIFMDIKIGEALKEKRLKDHAKISAKVAKEFLDRMGASGEIVENVVGCALSHHGNIPYTTKESEICANADCYRFLTPLGAASFIGQLSKRGMNLGESLDYLDRKLDEKWNIISFSDVRKELKTSYNLLKLFVQKAQHNTLEMKIK